MAAVDCNYEPQAEAIFWSVTLLIMVVDDAVMMAMMFSL
jgi:hypothetical protein